MFTLKLFRLLKAFEKNDFSKVDKISKMGILGVRIAQLYSTRIDILSQEMCYHLMNIHSSLIEIRPKSMLKILNRDENPLSILEFFDNEPYRVSYVYQVYTGTLKNGKDVVIKFTNIDSKHQFLKQLFKLEEAAKTISYFCPQLNQKFVLSGFIKFLKNTALTKTDLITEMALTKELIEYRNEYLEKYNLKTLHFSEFFPEYSTSLYLISKYKQTHSVKDLIEERKMKVKYVDDILKYHFFYIFVIGKFHSDIHRGNILIGEDHDEIIFIDTNSLNEISDNFRIYFYHFLLNLSQEKLSFAFNYLNLSLIKKINPKDEKELFDNFLKRFSNLNKKSVKQFNISKELMGFSKLAIEKGVEFPEDFFDLLKAFIRLEDIFAETIQTGVFANDLYNALHIFSKDDRLSINLYNHNNK